MTNEQVFEESQTNDVLTTPVDGVENITNEGEVNEEVQVETSDNSNNEEVSNITSEDDSNDEEQVFDKKYVTKLRKESEGYRKKAKRADDLEKQLHAALVKLDGRLADPEDLEFDAEHLDDADKLAEAIADLVSRKPGLKKQQLSGDVGAGKRGVEKGPSMDLIQIMKGL